MSDIITLNDVNQNAVVRQRLVGDLNLLRGVVVTKDGFAPSAFDLFDLNQFRSPLHTYTKDFGSNTTITVETQVASQSFNQWWTKASLSASTPWVSASASLSLSHSQSSSKAKTTIYSCAYDAITRGGVQFRLGELRDKLNPAFLNEINTVVTSSDDDGLKQRKLGAVFAIYGHIFRMQVLVGATLMCSSSVVSESAGTKEGDKLDLEATLQAGVGGYGAGVGGGYGTNTEKATTTGGKNVTLYYKANGGDLGQLLDPFSWRKSTNNFLNWVVIRVEQAIPIPHLLPTADPTYGDLNAAVHDLFAPLDAKWVSGNYADLPTILDNNKDWYWLARWDTGSDTGGKYLLVKEKYAGSKVLCPMTDWNSSKEDDLNLGTLDDDPTYTVWELTPTSANYVLLGIYFLNNDEAIDPTLGLGGEVYKRLRAVRGDLVVDGVLANTYDMWPTGTNYWTFRMAPPVNDEGDELGFNTRHFAMYVTAGKA